MELTPPCIPYPVKDSEFEVQAALYNRLKQDGFIVRGEVSARLSYSTKCRMDLVVYDQKAKPKVIIECKNSTNKDWQSQPTAFVRKSRQSQRYAGFGVPVLQCLAVAHIPFVYAAIVAEASK